MYLFHFEVIGNGISDVLIMHINFCRFSNIYVTAPSPENLKTLFDFVCKGFKVLDYKVKVTFFPC